MSIDPFMLKQIYQAIGQFIFGIQWNNIDSSDLLWANVCEDDVEEQQGFIYLL